MKEQALFLLPPPLRCKNCWMLNTPRLGYKGVFLQYRTHPYRGIIWNTCIYSTVIETGRTRLDHRFRTLCHIYLRPATFPRTETFALQVIHGCEGTADDKSKDKGSCRIIDDQTSPAIKWTCRRTFRRNGGSDMLQDTSNSFPATSETSLFRTNARRSCSMSSSVVDWRTLLLFFNLRDFFFSFFFPRHFTRSSL